MPLSSPGRVWLYLVPLIPSILCSIFVLYHLLDQRVRNHGYHLVLALLSNWSPPFLYVYLLPCLGLHRLSSLRHHLTSGGMGIDRAAHAHLPLQLDHHDDAALLVSLTSLGHHLCLSCDVLRHHVLLCALRYPSRLHCGHVRLLHMCRQQSIGGHVRYRRALSSAHIYHCDIQRESPCPSALSKVPRSRKNRVAQLSQDGRATVIDLGDLLLFPVATHESECSLYDRCVVWCWFWLLLHWHVFHCICYPAIEESEMFFQKLKVDRNPQKFKMVINRSDIYKPVRDL